MMDKLKKIRLPNKPTLRRLGSKLTARNAGLFAGLTTLFLFFSAKPTHAQTILGGAAFGISWFISMIAAIAIAVEAWILGFVLQISTGLANSPVVAIGFPVSLSIANLFFVLAIIVIAIATILRWQSYGIKQALWRLVVIAIAVNFGLILAGGILKFSDSLSFYFLDSVNPATSGDSNGFANAHGFASAIAGAFQPQQVAFLNEAEVQKGETGGGFLAMIKSALASGAAGPLGAIFADGGFQFGANFLQPIAIVVFATLFMLFMIIVLGVLIVMLVIRYVYLGILLILLPLAWAAWIFPATKGHWTKWWTTFIKQTFFAPIVLFFMWIAVQVSYNLDKLGDYKITDYTSDSNVVWAGISEVFTNAFSGTFQQFLQLTVLLGVMLGGIFAAQSMSIKFADAGVKAATGMAKGFGVWTGRKGLQYGGAPARRTQKRVADWAQSRKSVAGRFTAGLVSRGITRLSTVSGEDLVKKYTKDVASMSIPDLQAAALTSFGPRNIAIQQELGRRGALDGASAEITHSAANKKKFESFGQTDSYKKLVENVAGFSSAMYEAQKRLERGDASAAEDLRKAAKEFASNLKKDDLSKMQLNDLFSGKDNKFGLSGVSLKNLSQSLAYGIAAAAPTLAAGVLPKLKSTSLKNYSDQYRSVIADAVTAKDLTGEEGDELRKKFENALGANAMSLFGEAQPAGNQPAGGTSQPASA